MSGIQSRKRGMRLAGKKIICYLIFFSRNISKSYLSFIVISTTRRSMSARKRTITRIYRTILLIPIMMIIKLIIIILTFSPESISDHAFTQVTTCEKEVLGKRMEGRGHELSTSLPQVSGNHFAWFPGRTHCWAYFWVMIIILLVIIIHHPQHHCNIVCHWINNTHSFDDIQWWDWKWRNWG